MRQSLLLTAAVLAAAMALAPQPARAVTDEQVTQAIDKAKEWLINQGPGGSWPQEEGRFPGGRSDMALYTLAYIGGNPNHQTIATALEFAMSRSCEATYVRAMRVMALSAVLAKLAEPQRTKVRQALGVNVRWLIEAQGNHGGWNYESLHGGAGVRFDLSNTQMAILALWQASLAGVEIPASVWQRTQNLYYKLQHDDGSWNYGDLTHVVDGAGSPGYGSMTAAGLASIYILADMLDQNGGCPCLMGKSSGERAELNRRVELATAWLGREFVVNHCPGKPNKPEWQFYWLYAAERVGIAGGVRYFGTHNWYREGAEYLVANQEASGAWHNGNIVNTCFAMLFLYKGRAPVIYEKLDMGANVEWNNHRRDLASLTAYIERDKEQPFQWQIVGLDEPMEELHEAPILYLCPETAPSFTADEKKKLRAFTDTGGTILFEASCGNPAVRAWFKQFAAEVWPEWPVKPLGPDHASFLDPYPLKTKRPEILGIDDGLRTCVFYAMDDISCSWQSKAFAAREYVFKWGVNLFAYATDRAPMRGRLAMGPAKSDRYTSAVKGGGKAALAIARLKTDGDWTVNRNYQGLARIAEEVSKRTSIAVRVDEDGAAAAALPGKDAAYMTGSKEVALAEAERQGLKAYLAKGGFLWAEAAGGSDAFDRSFRKLAADMDWELKPVEKTAPLMTGRFTAAVGYDLASGVRFRRVLKIPRVGRPWAEFVGIYQDGKMVGVYSPLDAVFAATPYEASGCHGYMSEDAMAVATNIICCISDR